MVQLNIHRIWNASQNIRCLLLELPCYTTVEPPKLPRLQDALQELLERKRAELHNAERLLKNMEIENEHNNNNHNTYTITSTSNAQDHKKRSVRSLSAGAANSIISGVDYGFISRCDSITSSFSFRSKHESPFEGYGPPKNIISLGVGQFIRNINAILGKYENNLVARMPYFSYISMLHLYETLGIWRRSSDIIRVHFAEEWNEYHHLLITESLGGDQDWWVRFLSQHAAVLYYWILVALWAISPALAYKFSELLETHAVCTYSQFLDDNEEILKDLPPSLAALEYYAISASDPLFAEYQNVRYKEGGEVRRPGYEMRSLYDVFAAIRDDESDHVDTMISCLDSNFAVRSPTLK